MEQNTYPRILSDREQKEWIEVCPVYIKRVKLTVPSKESGIVLSAVIVPCGGFDVEWVSASAEFFDARHKTLTTVDNITFHLGESEGEHDGEIPEGAVYAYITVKSVKYGGGRVWENSEGAKGTVLPTQGIIWQTDPMYEAIRYVCSGVVEAKYYPDEPLMGAWRCACGQVNLACEGAVCGACGCEKKWLDEHFDEAYLTEAAKELSVQGTFASKKKPRKQKKGISDKTKFILILSAAAVVIAAAVMAPFVGRTVRYSKAEGYLAKGEYDLAIEEFTKLEGFSDSEKRLQEANYQKALEMTGLDEVNMVWSSRMKCFSITQNGVLSFRPDDYTGDWESFVIPDVVDGIVVRELDKNFFMNCKELETVTISDCVEVLGDGTFFNCESLREVNFGKNVRELGARCFINCTGLREITIPDTVEKVGIRCFNSCTELEKVTLGSGITKLPDYLFSDCRALGSVTVKGEITEVGESAFAECGEFDEIVFHGAEEPLADLVVKDGNEALLAANVKYK
ncbi:MAG: leucine-rich repeat domain-containing protein [Ruminococcaceae bacterium]|nr:leucine-rich repeat domain-containing protein [Oscillospiraceae bacterium]